MRFFIWLLTCLSFAGQTPVEDLNKLYHEYFEFTMRDSPEAATLVGRTEFNDKWTDYSPAANDSRKATWKSLLDRGRRHATASHPASERMSQRLFIDTLERELETVDFEPYMKPVNHYVGPARIVPLIFESAPNRTMKDFEDQIARLRATPEMVNGIIAAANEGLRRRIQSPARTAQLLLPLLEAQTRADAAQNPLLKAFRQMPASISQQDRERLTNDASKAYEEAFRPAWRKLSRIR